jgi:hypothetical protein
VHELWTLDSLKNNYGELEVSVGRIPYGTVLPSSVTLLSRVSPHDVVCT